MTDKPTAIEAIPEWALEIARACWRQGCEYPKNHMVADSLVIHAFARALVAEREAATAKERERCARICETGEGWIRAFHMGNNKQSQLIAAAIRKGD